MPEKTHAYVTRTVDNILFFNTRHNFFKNSLLPQSLNGTIQILPLGTQKSFVAFKNSILKFVRPSPSSVFDCDNQRGIRLITRLRVGLSYLREHKFKHSFQDCLNPICSCGLDIKSISHFFLYCLLYLIMKNTLLSTLHKIDCKLLELANTSLSHSLLYDNVLFDKRKKINSFSTQLLNYILSTERFEEPLI